MDQIKIGAFLKVLRKEKGMTQEQLAEKLNVSNRSVSRWETGNTLPDISILIELSEFYGVEIKEILDGERKSENMNDREKEIVSKVVDYTSKDKEIILKKSQMYSGLAGVMIAVCIVLSAFNFKGRFERYIEVLIQLSEIFVVTIWLMCSGKAAEMKKDKSKRIKAQVLIAALLLITVIVILVAVGAIQ